MVMQGPSFISGRAAVIGYLGERGGGGSLVIKTASDIHSRPATMGRKVRETCASVETCSESEITSHNFFSFSLSPLFKSDSRSAMEK